MTTAGSLFWSRAVRVFDLDGTLVDTLPDLTRALNVALSDLGLPEVDSALVRASLHAGLEGSVDAALVAAGAPAALTDMLLARYRLHYDALLSEQSLPYPGVPELLEQLRLRGDRLAVCTNKQEPQALRLLGSLGLAAYFSSVVGADTCGQRKPHPAPLLHAIGALGGTCVQALMVGDSVVDLHCAQAAGVDCVLFAGGYGTGAEGPVSRFESYAELLAAQSPLPRWVEPLLVPR
ncbi:MAG: HAD-IA family hydrolase [Aquabacterium sp.]|nr:HAD-IA family hydrolase [Aquabacterium sp.]